MHIMMLRLPSTMAWSPCTTQQRLSKYETLTPHYPASASYPNPKPAMTSHDSAASSSWAPALQNPKTLANGGKLALLPEAGTALRRRETPLATRVAWGAAFVLIAATAAGALADRTDRLVPPGWVPCTASATSVRPADGITRCLADCAE